MGPLALLSLGKTLLDSGPAMVRGIGSLFGGKTAEVTSKVANFVDEVKGLPKDKAEAKLAARLESLPSGDLVELEKVQADLELELAKVEERRESNRLQAETNQHNASMETIRTEATHGTDYVKETRPKLARVSAYASITYTLVAEAARLISSAWGGELQGADPAIIGTLFGPCGFYMTMRTADAFSNKGKS